jgi:hypothetical protein
MNKIVASVSLVALGAASVQAQSTPRSIAVGMAPPAPKWWNVSASVRGFYDDNANSAPNSNGTNKVLKVATWGYEVSPSVGVSLGNAQTTFNAGYTFSYLYYEKPLINFVGHGGRTAPTTKDDMTHTFNAALDHAFSPRYSLHASDAFVIGQQPDALRTGNSINAFQRISGNNIVNSAAITLNGVLTPLLGFEAGYNNGLFDYDAEQLSGPLNRNENYAHFDLRWTVAHETIAVVGYQFGDVVYTGSGPFANPQGIGVTNGVPAVKSISIRDTISHTGYVGADHTFLPNLIGSVRAGVSYYDYYNDTGANNLGPYAQVNLTYTYAPESHIAVGFTESRIASSITGVINTNSPNPNNSFVHDTETSTLYGSVVHRIMPRLYGSVRGTFQNSTYHGGGPGIDGQSDRFYDIETDLEYRFTPNFSVHGGYLYNQLCSTLGPVVGPRDYDRNKFYIGATASY